MRVGCREKDGRSHLLANHAKSVARPNHGRLHAQLVATYAINYGHVVGKTDGDHIAEVATAYTSTLPDTHNGLVPSKAAVKSLDRALWRSPVLRLGFDPTLHSPAQSKNVTAPVFAPCEQDFQLYATQCTFLMPGKFHPSIQLRCPSAECTAAGASCAPVLRPDGYCCTTKRVTDLLSDAVTTVVLSQTLRCKECGGTSQEGSQGTAVKHNLQQLTLAAS